MQKLLDGPGKDQVLRLRRMPMPYFLRVVFDGQEWDGLDQLSDTPRPNETIYAYHKVRSNGSVHINSRDKKGRHNGGYFEMSDYAFIEPQPDDATMRDNERWAEWAHAQYAVVQEARKSLADQPGGAADGSE